MHISFYSILPFPWVLAHVELLWPRHRAHMHAMAFGYMPTLVCHGLGSVHTCMPWRLATCHVGSPWPKQFAHKHAYGHIGISK